MGYFILCRDNFEKIQHIFGKVIKKMNSNKQNLVCEDKKNELNKWKKKTVAKKNVGSKRKKNVS